MENNRKYFKKTVFFIFSLIAISVSFAFILSKDKTEEKTNVVQEINLNQSATGNTLSLSASVGSFHNHPLMAIWIEDMQGNYIQTIFVANSIAKGVFNYGEVDKGKWMPGEIRRPAALPYWAHKRGVKATDGLFIPDKSTPIADAYTGATPSSNFIVKAKTDKFLPDSFAVFLEVNQPWDWNDFWNNTKYLDNDAYRTSCQPAIIYRAYMSLKDTGTVYLKLIGHSHYAGQDGSLNTDVSTLTTSLNIFKDIFVKIEN